VGNRGDAVGASGNGKPIMRLVGIIFVICAFFVFLGFGIGSTIVTPDHALAFVPSTRNVYIAPPCLSQEKQKLIPQLTIRQARILKLNPEPNCRDEGGFIQEGRSLSGTLLEQLGLLGQMQSRWNPDGTWNW
jgi:hypothetical protein